MQNNILNIFILLMTSVCCTACAAPLDISTYLGARGAGIFTASPGAGCMVSTNQKFRVHFSSVTTNTPYFSLFPENLVASSVGKNYPENAILLTPGVPVIEIGNSTPIIDGTRVTYEALSSIVSNYDKEIREKFRTFQGGNSFHDSGNLIIAMKNGTNLENFDKALLHLKPTAGWRNLIIVLSAPGS